MHITKTQANINFWGKIMVDFWCGNFRALSTYKAKGVGLVLVGNALLSVVHKELAV